MKRFEIKIKDMGIITDSFKSDEFIDIEERVKKLRRLKFL